MLLLHHVWSCLVGCLVGCLVVVLQLSCSCLVVVLYNACRPGSRTWGHTTSDSQARRSAPIPTVAWQPAGKPCVNVGRGWQMDWTWLSRHQGTSTEHRIARNAVEDKMPEVRASSAVHLPLTRRTSLPNTPFVFFVHLQHHSKSGHIANRMHATQYGLQSWQSVCSK